MSHNRFFRVNALLFFIVPLFCINASEQLWLTLNSIDRPPTEACKSRSNAEFRFPETEDWTFFRFSQKFFNNLNKNCTTELHPTKFKLGENGPKVTMRNRWEVLWKEGLGNEVFDRIRKCPTLTWNPNKPHFNNYRIGYEVLQEVDKSMITLNPSYPAVPGILLFGSISTRSYGRYQSKRAVISDDWDATHVSGASVKI